MFQRYHSHIITLKHRFAVQKTPGYLLSRNCHLYNYILKIRDAKLFTCLESFSSKFKCPMIEIFGTVSPVF